MKDKLLKFGAVTGATKATVAYTADVLDMGATEKTGNLDNINVIIKARTAMASADTVVLQVYESSDNSSFTLIQSGKAVCLAADEAWSMPMPKTHKRYMKAGVLPDSTGTFTSTVFDVWIQPGM